jgi:hypothetical protein
LGARGGKESDDVSSGCIRSNSASLYSLHHRAPGPSGDADADADADEAAFECGSFANSGSYAKAASTSTSTVSGHAVVGPPAAVECAGTAGQDDSPPASLGRDARLPGASATSEYISMA